MNIKASLIALAALNLASPGAHAVHVPGSERPLYRAEMKVADARGDLSETKEAHLTLTALHDENEGLQHALNLVLDGETMIRLFVDSITTDGCGSKTYQARGAAASNTRCRSPGNGTRCMSRERFTMTLVDHGARVCKDFRPYRWEAGLKMTIMGINPKEPITLGSVELMGHPEMLNSIL